MNNNFDFNKLFFETNPFTDKDCEGILKATLMHTKLGPMIVIADDKGLYLLEFTCCRNLERKIERLKANTKARLVKGINDPIQSITQELNAYFEGTLKEFRTPLHILGSPFQKDVWKELIRTPFGKTRSYMDQAIAINKEKAYRAVANANGANQLAVVIPCHRIMNANGNLGGYGGGIAIKKWLIEHEASYV